MRLADKVAAAAVEAGNIMLTDAGFSVDNKGTKENYVTSTDMKVESFLKERLTGLVPGSSFLGEEGDENVGDADVFWIVDPIDGTANYARGVPASVVSIALARSGEIVLGVVRNPYTDETFVAEKGKGAFLNGKRLTVSGRTREHCLVFTAWSCYNKSLAHYCFDVSQKLYAECEDIRRIGTAAYELCLLAKGAGDLYFEIRLAPWDYAAASLVVAEAGGVCRSLDGPVELKKSCSVVGANNPENLDYILGVVKDTLGGFRV